MSSPEPEKDPYVADITFRDGSTRRVRYVLFHERPWGFVLQSEAKGKPVLRVPSDVIQTLEARVATDDD